MFRKGRRSALSNGGKDPIIGIGTGYLSIMMIFVVLCLTMLAALSYSSAAAEKKYSDKSGEYTREYYAADLEAKRVLAEIDAVAAEYGGPQGIGFADGLTDIEGVSVLVLPDGAEVSWQTPVNEKQSISAKVRYSLNGYEITEWKTVFSSESENKPLNVWSGE